MQRYLNRKAFVTTLGVAGLGLGMTAATLGSAPGALAQEDDAGADDALVRIDHDELQAEFYAAFTVALGEELGISGGDEVDAGIRAALATVVDGLQGDDLVTPGQATAVKALIETLEVPVGPGPMGGHRAVMFKHAVAHEGGPELPRIAAAAAEGEEPSEGPGAIAQRFYPDFTAALADELGAGSADEVDGAIRVAMMTVIDELDTDALPVPIPTDALKAMVATAESPLGPGLLFGPPPGLMIRAFHGPGHDGDGPAFHGRGGDDGRFGERNERARAGDGDATEDEGPANGDAEDADDDTEADDEASN